MGTDAPENLTEAVSPLLDAAGSPTAAGVIIGPYQLLQLIGEGGMGQVWLAEQKQPVHRRVALKLIKVGMDTREVVARFESERQALALMDHPAIAKVFDAGSTPEGRPYFVMEYVAGLPINDYCDRHRLTMRQRMELFIQVCEGVQHAHQKAIIHRDLKPSNILVTEVDGRPAPRIIDFGIAKATSQPVDAATMFTRLGSVIGTLGYMSPEQAGSGGEDIDTRSDVYSLGVVLYELLVGALPLDFKKLALEEALRRLRDQDAPRPSTRLRTLGGDSAVTAQNRGTALPTLTRQLQGDADAIALKALEKDRRRRYASPSELAADLERYLRNEPVSAHPPSRAYRARKYIRRHRVGVGLASAVVLLLLGFAIAQAVELRTIRKERDRADRITGFMTDMFKVSDPSEARGNDIRVREVLDKASTQIVNGLANEPEDQARLMQVMGDVYRNLGLYPQSESLTRRALAIDTRVLGANDPGTLKSMDTLSGLLTDESRYPEAEKMARETLERRTHVRGAEDRDTVNATRRLAQILADEGRYAEAEPVNRKTFEIARRKFGPADPDTINAEAALAINLAYAGKLTESDKTFRDVLQKDLATVGPDDLMTIKAESNLGSILLHEKKPAEAEKLFRAVIEKESRIFGPDHPRTLLDMGNLGLALSDQEHYPEAEKLFRETLAIKTRKLGAEHRSTLVTAGNLANVLRYEKKYAEAEQLIRQTLAIEERTLGKDHSDTLDSKAVLGQVLGEEGHYPEAERVLREAYDSLLRVVGQNHHYTAESAYDLAVLYAAEGKKREAVTWLTTAVDHGLLSSADLGLGTDPSLKPLHGDPAFEALVARAREPAKIAANAKPGS
jgi:non-specific serine/threonine protein kinase/serine/threonine-protein kinase